MKFPLAVFGLCFVAFTLCAQSERYHTLRTFTTTGSDGQLGDSFNLATNELATLIEFRHYVGFYSVILSLTNNPTVDGLAFEHKGTVLPGPATVTMNLVPIDTNAPASGFWGKGYATFKVETVNLAGDVQRTAVAPAGYPVAVALESSTNLVSWQAATNGAWPASDAHRFFRVNLRLSAKD